MFRVPNKNRLRTGPFASTDQDGNNGVFAIAHPNIKDYHFLCIASDGAVAAGEPRWEHVSVHLDSRTRKVDRCPTWAEMCFIKGIFWEDSDRVVQFHPPKDEYVNIHPTTLHLWRPVDQELCFPNPLMVGPLTKEDKP